MSFVKLNWLDAETASVVTNPEEITGTATYGLQVSSTGGPSLLVILEGSIDGNNWFTVASRSADGVSYSSDFTRNPVPVRLIRLVLSMSGGTAPTVSASVIAV